MKIPSFLLFMAIAQLQVLAEQANQKDVYPWIDKISLDKLGSLGHILKASGSDDLAIRQALKEFVVSLEQKLFDTLKKLV